MRLDKNWWSVDGCDVPGKDSASKSNMLSGRSFVLISCYIQQFMAGKWSLNQTQELNRCGDSGTKYPGSCKLMYCK